MSAVEQDVDLVVTESEHVGLLFGAPWCPVWGRLRTHLEESQDERVAPWVAVDVDEAPHLADRYLVMTLPTLLLIQNGRETARLHGAFSPSQATALLRRGRTQDQAEPERRGRRS